MLLEVFDMILKIKMKDSSRKNIEIIKSHLFSETDKITAGYIIGLAVERTTDISDCEWKAAVEEIFYVKESLKSISTSISLRQEIFDKINQIKEMLHELCAKSLYTSQVIDIILSIVANRMCKNSVNTDSLIVSEWNINARSGLLGCTIPVTLIASEIFKKNPHIFVLTEFVKTVGWLDLKSILEEKYHVYDSPFFLNQNGICIGLRKECGIEFLSSETKNSIFKSCLNTPDFYEVKVRINSKIISVIGIRIRIDYWKARSKDQKIRILEQRQRFEQYNNLVEYISHLDNVIVLGDFNNSRILSNEYETDITIINNIYRETDSIEHNFQKMRLSLQKKTDRKFSLYTAAGDKSSVGASWDIAKKKATPPRQDERLKNKYDHIITNFCLQNAEYDWNFLNFYNAEQFALDGRIVPGYPDHAIFVAEINLIEK